MSTDVDIYDVVPLLERRLAERREYQVTRDGYCHQLNKAQIERFQKASNVSKRALVARPSNGIVMYSDLAIRGPGRQRVLAKKWGIPLPSDYCKFCDLYAEYILVGRVMIGILGSDEIELENGIRLGWSVPDSATRRLFYFARVLGHTAHFAFRWNEDFSKMDIVYSWDYGDIGEPVLLGPDSDRFVTDKSFISWLTRLLKSDCYPVFPGRWIPTSERSYSRPPDRDFVLERKEKV